MKKIISLVSLLAVFSVHALEGKIEEEVFVTDHKALEKIPSEFTVDHLQSFGFELYGPKGMKRWLKQNNISFMDMPHEHHQKDFAADYPSFEELEANLRSYVALNPKIAKLFSIGKSVEGRDLWVVKISDNVSQDELEPEFKYISSMHGDEITGRELTQFLVRDMITAYGKDPKITELIDETEIYIMPSMNPDGSEMRRRANKNGYDLNRNFPDWMQGDVNSSRNRQPETQHIMKFQASRNFSLSANFHGGAVVVNYPWDNTYTRHPLDSLLKDISTRYAELNPGMISSRSFPGGITNGADWYKVNGGMQDWSYFWYNDLQVTVELSRRKWPRYRNIPQFYQDNKESMLTYLGLIHRGAGIHFNDSSVTGQVKILNNDTQSNLGEFVFSRGEFYKVLPVGDYQFNVTTNTGEGHIVDVSVRDGVIGQYTNLPSSK